MSSLDCHDLKEAVSFSSWVYAVGENLSEGDVNPSSMMYGIAPSLERKSMISWFRSLLTRMFCFRRNASQPGNYVAVRNDNSPIAFVLEDQRTSGHLVKYVDGTLQHPQTTMQYAIAVNTVKQRIYVVFRGTDELRDWLANLNPRSQELNNDVSVHRGFYKLLHAHLADLFASIEALLAQNQYAQYSVHVYGHSLGGALSSLFGYLLATHFQEQNRHNKIHVITVAAPAVGNSAFRKECESLQNLSTVRMVYKNDFAPGCSFADNSYHVGRTLVYLHENRAKVYQNYDYPESLDSVGNCYSVGDHDLKRYWKAINSTKVADGMAKNGVLISAADCL